MFMERKKTSLLLCGVEVKFGSEGGGVGGGGGGGEELMDEESLSTAVNYCISICRRAHYHTCEIHVCKQVPYLLTISRYLNTLLYLFQNLNMSVLLTVNASEKLPDK